MYWSTQHNNNNDDGQPPFIMHTQTHTHTDSFLYILLAFEYKCTIFLIYILLLSQLLEVFVKKKIHSQINTTTNF